MISAKARTVTKRIDSGVNRTSWDYGSVMGDLNRLLCLRRSHPPPRYACEFEPWTAHSSGIVDQARVMAAMHGRGTELLGRKYGFTAEVIEDLVRVVLQAMSLAMRFQTSTFVRSAILEESSCEMCRSIRERMRGGFWMVLPESEHC